MLPTSLVRTYAPWLTAMVCLAAVVPLASSAAESIADTPAKPPGHGFTFSLLPKAFQRAPNLEMTVFTDVTPYGRLMRAPTPENPTYYISLPAGYKQMGDTVGGEKPPPKEQLERAMVKSLATNGYQPATTPSHPPSLVIFYFWGSHNRMDPEMEQQFPQQAAQQRLQRAILVGGRSFLQKTANILEWGENLTDRTSEYEFLRDQANSDLYYVVASAYDYAALAHKERKLVWRTTMTVAAAGVAMDETLSPLINTAGPYFGHETPDPKILEKKFERWSVHVGEDRVIESDVPLTKPGTPKSRPAPTPTPAPADASTTAPKK